MPDIEPLEPVPTPSGDEWPVSKKTKQRAEVLLAAGRARVPRLKTCLTTDQRLLLPNAEACEKMRVRAVLGREAGAAAMQEISCCRTASCASYKSERLFFFFYLFWLCART